MWGGDRGGVPLGFFLQYGISGNISPPEEKIGGGGKVISVVR